MGKHNKRKRGRQGEGEGERGVVAPVPSLGAAPGPARASGAGEGTHGIGKKRRRRATQGGAAAGPAQRHAEKGPSGSRKNKDKDRDSCSKTAPVARAGAGVGEETTGKKRRRATHADKPGKGKGKGKGKSKGQGQGQGQGQGKRKDASQGDSRRVPEAAPTGPGSEYCGGDSVLVLGDGDFSFSCAVARRRRAPGLVATSLDARAAVLAKYGARARESLGALAASSACEAALHGVDATALLATLPAGGRRAFDRVVFNFPHTGSQRVHENRALLRDFFQSARDVLLPAARVDVTLKDGPPYSGWDLEAQARAASFALVDMRPFPVRAFPGYAHQTTQKEATEAMPEKRSTTYSFMVLDSTQP